MIDNIHFIWYVFHTGCIKEKGGFHYANTT